MPSAMLRATPDDGADAVSQLAQGEAFAVVDISVGWAWGYGLHDRYVGYLRAEMLGPLIPPTHVVTVPVALVFAAPDIKAPVVATRTIGSRLHGTTDDSFVATAGGYVHVRHLAPVDAPVADPVAVAETLVGAPYLWGGRGDGGVDCSGLVQRALGLAGIAAPRDSDQQRTLGREIGADEALQRGDIILFPGHVGLMVDGTRLIHANAHWMAVTIEPLDTVTERGATIVARRRMA